MSTITQRRTAEGVAAGATALLATIAFVAWRDGSARWASAAPGHALGALGLALMLWAGFGYGWRKRSAAPGATSMQTAMQAHILAGLLGPYLVILHSGFAFRGLAGALTLMTVLVVASGVLGRAVFSAVPKPVSLVDPVRAAMLDAELASAEGTMAAVARAAHDDPVERAALERRLVALRHEQALLNSQWRQSAGTATTRRTLSVWWWLHAPASIALWVLALAHVAGTLWYGALSR
jgi:hypothetical protein